MPMRSPRFRPSSLQFVLAGSLALHALALWALSRAPAAPAKVEPPLIEVALVAPVPTESPTIRPVVTAVAPPRKKVKAEKVVRAKVTPKAVTRPKPVEAPTPRPIETIPPPRERTTPIIAPPTLPVRKVPSPKPVIQVTPVPNPQPASPVVAPTAAPASQTQPDETKQKSSQSTGTTNSGGGGGGGGANAGGATAGNSTAGGISAGGITSGGVTAGGITAGGVTSGGVSAGGVTAGGITSGGVTSGGVTSGGVTSGGVTAGGVTAGVTSGGVTAGTTGGPARGGGGPYGLPGGGQGARQIVYVLDVSPSMKERIGRAESELREAMDKLVAGESFNVIAFDAKAYALDNRLLPATPANVARARKFLSDQRLKIQENRSNGTNLQLALRKALQTKNVNALIVITDGEPTVGQTDYATIASKARSQNRSRARIDTIGLIERKSDGSSEFGAGRLLEQIARENGGQYKAVLDE